MNSIFNNNELLFVPDTKTTELKFLGNGKRKLLILINKNENGVGPKEFLKKILNAKKINLEEDVYLLPIDSTENLSFIQLKKDKEINQAIFFGINPIQLGFNLNLKKYETENLNEITLLYSDEISKIEKSESLKRQLWGCLKDWPMNEG